MRRGRITPVAVFYPVSPMTGFSGRLKQAGNAIHCDWLRVLRRFTAQNIPHLFHRIAGGCAELQKMAEEGSGRANPEKTIGLQGF